MGKLYILETGRADCIVILAGQGADRRVAVVDGGCMDYKGRAVLLEFLERQKINRIDLQILTHVHQDHFGGFVHLADRVEIKASVMPYGDIRLSPAAAVYFGPEECFAEYHVLYRWLRKCSAEVLLSYEICGHRFPLGEDTFLSCLYPVSPPDSVRNLDAMCDPTLSGQAMEDAVKGYKSTCNASSSIWVLEKSGQAIALLSGDCTIQAMDQCLPLSMESPWVLKLSHHGINNNHFSAEQVKKIAPTKAVVVCNDRSYYNKIHRECEEVCAAVGLQPYYTFQGDFIMTF